jgi:hypothetical protein
MDNKSVRTLYSYLVGCNEAQREDRRMKCFSFKEVSKNVKSVFKSDDEELKDGENEEKEPDSQSDFCRINPQNSFTFVSKTLHGFVVGPHSFSDIGGKPSMKNFAPIVYFTDPNTGEVKSYKLVVYVGHKTMLALLFNSDFEFDYDYLCKLDAHLAKHAPIISQLIDIAVNKVL